MAKGDLTGTALIAEYNSLRTEIDRRSQAQQTLSNLALTLTGATVAYALANDAIVVLLLQPIIASALGMLYADHGKAIRRAGRYVELHLAPALTDLADDARVLLWEKVAHSGGTGMTRLSWFVPPLLVFVGSSLGVLVAALPARVFDRVARDSNLLQVPLPAVGLLWLAGLLMVLLAAWAFRSSFRDNAMDGFDAALGAAQGAAR